ncbi:hypothetical protein [uncultured Pseudodesulfovibrio sp.]|uniref:hypothetical protein n=1 Tax=uncultured Pseudodesulfovibrio sp. TaxID=2035858 RepID=UPI0029C72A37|nr:hypothetical protein [uncultured Pseudodesulfovibrio sp.]
MIDMEIWIGLIGLTAILYLIKWLQGRKKNTVYRISADSLKRSKEVMLTVLPLVEDGEEGPIDSCRLPYAKDSVKSAAKILAYYYWKQDRPEELLRVKQCFVSLSRFQDRDLDPISQEKHCEREKARLTRELNCYMTHSPFKTRKSGRAA